MDFCEALLSRFTGTFMKYLILSQVFKKIMMTLKYKVTWGDDRHPKTMSADIASEIWLT
jgi:hypothetical protein